MSDEPNYNYWVCCDRKLAMYHCPTCEQTAGDRVAALEAELAEARSQAEKWKAKVPALRTFSAEQRGDEQTPYEQVRDDYADFRTASHKTIATLRAEVARLREMLFDELGEDGIAECEEASSDE